MISLVCHMVILLSITLRLKMRFLTEPLNPKISISLWARSAIATFSYSPHCATRGVSSHCATQGEWVVTVQSELSLRVAE